MGNRSLGTLTLDLIANTGGFREGMSQAERAAEKANQKIRKETAHTIDTVGKWGAAAGAAAAAVSVALGAVVLQGIETVAQQNDLAESIGITNRELTALSRAADLSGVSQDELSVAMKKLNKTIGDAQGGSKSASAALGALGLTADKLAQMPMDQRFNAIAQSISGLATQTERAAAVQDIMGKSAQSLLPMLQDGGKTIAQAARQTEQWGLALSELDVANIAAADDRMSDVSATISAMKRHLAAEFAPVITVISERLLDLTKDVGGFRNKAREMFEGLLIGAGHVADAFQKIHKFIKVVEVGIGGVSVAYNTLVGSLTSVGTALDRITGHRGADEIAIRQSEVTKAISESMSSLAQSKKELEDISSAPAASGFINGFLKDIEEAASRTKKTIKEVVDEADAPIRGPNISANDSGIVIDDFQTFLKQQNDIVEQNRAAMRAADDSARAEWRAAQMEDLTNWTEIQIESADIVDKHEQKLMQSRQKRFSETHELLGNLSTLMNTQSRKMFEIGKAAAIANTIVSTYEGATKSYASLASIPFVGPALAFGARAAAIASGLASVAAIRGTSFGGGGGASAGISNTQAVNAASVPVGNAGGMAGGQTMDIRIIGSSRPSWDEVAQAMEMMGDSLARSGGRMGKVTVLTA